MSTQRYRQELLKLLCTIKDLDEMGAFLEVILSEKELSELDNRIQILKMLTVDKTQREIQQALDVGIATVIRGAKVYKNPNVESSLKRLFKKCLSH